MASAIVVVVAAALAGALPPPPTQVVLTGRGSFGEVHFDHAAHLARRISCASCHGPGPVHKPELTPATAHATCRACHAREQRGPTSCRDCHVNVREARRPGAEPETSAVAAPAPVTASAPSPSPTLAAVTSSSTSTTTTTSTKSAPNIRVSTLARQSAPHPAVAGGRASRPPATAAALRQQHRGHPTPQFAKRDAPPACWPRKPATHAGIRAAAGAKRRRQRGL